MKPDLLLNQVKKGSEHRKKASRILITRFEDYHYARGHAEDTIRKYARVVERYLETCDDPFQRTFVDRFLADLRRRGSSGTHRRWIFAVLKIFFRASQQEWPFESGDSPKVSEAEVPVHTSDDMTALEEAAKTWETKSLAVRNYALVRLANALGLRRGEIRNLNISDYKKPYIRIHTLKGGRIVNRTLDPETSRALDEWLKTRRRRKKAVDPDALFIRGTRGSRLSVRGLNYIFHQISEKAGIEKKKAGFHASRRGRVTDLHKRGISGPQLTKEWGWKSDQTVNTYIKLSKRDVEQAIQEVHPYFQDEDRREDR